MSKLFRLLHTNVVTWTPVYRQNAAAISDYLTTLLDRNTKWNEIAANYRCTEEQSARAIYRGNSAAAAAAARRRDASSSSHARRRRRQSITDATTCTRRQYPHDKTSRDRVRRFRSPAEGRGRAVTRRRRTTANYWPVIRNGKCQSAKSPARLSILISVFTTP